MGLERRGNMIYALKKGKIWIRGPERDGGKRSLGKDGQAGIHLFHPME